MSKEEYSQHKTVLLNEVIDALSPVGKEVHLLADFTFGGGGHTILLAQKNQMAKLFAVDQDADALKNGKARLEEEGLSHRVQLVPINFEKFPDFCEKEGLQNFDGIVMDLGVSSHHFDNAERGFSYRADAALDMRMDQSRELTAKEVINTFDQDELADIFFEYGEEHFSRKIAENIVIKRGEKEIETTGELEDIVFHTYPKKFRFGRTHPATKVFQALRIYVNRELDVLKNTLVPAIKLLAPQGRLAVITFHSLEDRIVKHTFIEAAKELGLGIVLTKKPMLPSKEELESNKRSRSAKLRIFERL